MVGLSILQVCGGLGARGGGPGLERPLLPLRGDLQHKGALHLHPNIYQHLLVTYISLLVF